MTDPQITSLKQAALSPDKKERLQTFLGALPSASAGKLFTALENDYAYGGEGLPHQEMLTTLRRKLFEQDEKFPTRPMTAKRKFYEPFEDFFIPERQGRKRQARIARTSLDPIWAILQNDPSCASVQRLTGKLVDALDGEKKKGDRRRSTDLKIILDALYPAAAHSIGKLVDRAKANEAYHARLVQRLGGEGGYEDFIELQTMMSGVEHLVSVQEAFAKPVSILTQQDLYTVRGLYGAAYEEAPDAAVYSLLRLAARMETPWRSLSIYYHLNRAKDENLPFARHDASVIGEMLFYELEELARGLEHEASQDFVPANAELRLAHFTEYADGMQMEAARYSDSVFLNRIEACRDVAAEALERFAEQSVAAMREAMPVRQSGGSSRLMSVRPDILQEILPETERASQEAAVFLARMGDAMRRLHERRTVRALVDEATDQARQYANDLVTEIRAAEGDDRVQARRLMTQTLDLISPLFPDDEIGLLRDKASAAAVSA